MSRFDPEASGFYYRDHHALAAFHRLCRTEGIIPALESSHALAYATKLAPSLGRDRIILVKRQDACVFCRSSDDLKEFRGRMICAGCLGELNGGPEVRTWEMFSEEG